jgi:hypothetical protein
MENEVNIKTTTTPSVKPNFYIPLHPDAGLWIADENVKICKWKKILTGNI